ncbi:BON domain-containing protein [Sphingobacterium hungaricum]|uniref:Transporter n=1 Tax=Sphingobacterium hungaricum TaxID=2082723 RepID=A0A928UX50_9SPHI|nr:BON domain-containing protein [Sphingobacterium hungaricum]MBE8714916.1 transporter [Sphingobacterium hungaricum]
MKLKQFIPLLMLVFCFALVTSCKSKVSDADIKAKVETAMSPNPTVMVDVKDGVVTLTGDVQTDEDKRNLENAAKAAEPKAIKSIVNNLTVAPIEINTDDADLTAKVVDATKDFPNVKATVADGVITVTGEVEQARVQTLKMSLDALNPKKVDFTGLQVK